MADVQSPARNASAPYFQTRGVVLTPNDLTWKDWPARAKAAKLTTLALHPTPRVVEDFIQSAAGAAFLEQCRELGLEVEYELHAMGELLPRSLFDAQPGLFRMTKTGDRTPDANLCVHSEEALKIVQENAVRIAQVLRPTTHRYFYWGDDGKPFCRCPKCKGLSDSDQALLLANRILDALRTFDAKAQVAYLAYANTLTPPTHVAPQAHIFLEFAPIDRVYDVPIEAPDHSKNRQNLDLLNANLALFRPNTAQALEYWLDCSRFSHWRQPHVKIPWSPEIFAADLDTYGARGMRHITTFAVYIDAEYLKQHGDPPLDDYGRLLAQWPDT